MSADLIHTVRAVFAPDGVLAQSQPQFRPREGQTAMAEAVAKAIEDEAVLVVQAGTGVGKTYSYLVPALLSGKRVVVSTATKALQDQLFARDLPKLVKTLGLPIRMARLKGRSSYLCKQRLLQVRLGKQPLDAQVLRAVARVEDWARTTRTGDMAELPDVAEDSQVMPLVTSTRDNCVGRECAHWEACHVNHARQQALEADVTVVNHHLFFADMEVRESGVAQLLPEAGVVVVDEAHQLNETGIQFAGLVLSTNQLLGFSRDVMQDASEHARGMADWLVMAARLQQSIKDWRLIARPAQDALPRMRWTARAPDGLNAATWQAALVQVGRNLRTIVDALGQLQDMAAALVHLHERGSRLLQQLAHFARLAPSDCVRWLDVGRQHMRLVESPLQIARLMQEQLMAGHPSLAVQTFTDADMQAGGAWGDLPTDAVQKPSMPPEGVKELAPSVEVDIADASKKKLLSAQAQSHTAWIFTSATLGMGGDLRWFTEPCGLRGARQLLVDSPFDYAQHAALYVPAPPFPLPSDAKHSSAVAQLAAEGAQALGGRTLVLTTTLKALEVIGTQLRAQLGLFSSTDVLVQGQGSKHALMQRFAAGTVNGRGCVLVASSSFWEGVDIPGDALQLVVIDKLPFPPPDDPLVQARSQQLEMLGRSAFFDYVLPEAALALKQGAGRLIRSETDRGILVIADTRLRSMGYGRQMLQALPPMHMMGSHEAWQGALKALATGCDPVPPSGEATVTANLA